MPCAALGHTWLDNRMVGIMLTYAASIALDRTDRFYC
jgi:hypothetical protein